MTYIFTIPYPNHYIQENGLPTEEDILLKEYKSKPTSPFEHYSDKEEFSGLFAAIDMEGLEEKEHEICIYVDELQKEDAESIIQEICAEHQVTFSITTVENKNWNEQWESGFQPILLDDIVWVRATFHQPNPTVKHEIIIEPKMSFGTGHHPTTSQMMKNMYPLEWVGKSVLDIGSGTGILSFFAEKLGASEIVAIDNDEWCYKNCLENSVLNNSKNVKPAFGDLQLVKNSIFDCILANIHRNFLIEYMSMLSAMLVENGFLLVSGFLNEDTKLILDAALEHNLIANYKTEQDNWACIVLQKNS